MSDIAESDLLETKLLANPAVGRSAWPRPSNWPQANTEAQLPSEGLKPKKRSPRRLLLFLAAIAGLTGIGFYGFDWYENGRFIVSTDDAYVRADMAVMAAKVSGYLADVPVTDNRHVHAGDLLARIDDGDYRLAVEAAQRKLDTQNATITRIGEQARAQEALVAQARAGLDSAQADAQRAGADFARAQHLAASGFGSVQSLDTARADRDRTAASVESANAALAAAQSNLAVVAAQKVEAEHLGAELKTALAQAQRDLSFTEIRAPFDGTIGNRAAQPGAYVQPGTRLMALVPLQSAYVEANLKETQLDRVKAGDPVSLYVDALGGRRFAGTVESIAPASGSQYSLLPPENATGNFTKIVQRVPVRIRVAGDAAAEGLLRPGLSVVVDIDTRTEQNATAKTAGANDVPSH
jgi:membrane fusion protein (multidrug efflux system)